MSEEVTEEVNEDFEDESGEVIQKNITEVESTGSSTMQIKQTDQIVIGGKKGSGKTNLAMTIVKWLINSGCPIIIIDPLYEYRDFEQMGATVVHIKYGNVTQFNNYINTLFNK